MKSIYKQTTGELKATMAAAAQKHTPGPWSVVNSHCVIGPHDELGTGGVAMCGMTRRTKTEQCANAALIASTPELLAALEACEAVLDDVQGIIQCRTELKYARAAIAKAKGGRRDHA